MSYESYLSAKKSYELEYRFKMVWQKYKNGDELLAKVHMGTQVREYLGKRNHETEKIKDDFNKAKERIKERLSTLKTQLKRDEKLNKLESINRAPVELVAVFRKINELGLDDNVVSIGTNSLYAFESKASVFIEQEFLATRDIDLLNRKNKGLSFIFNKSFSATDAESLLQSIDSSFQQQKNIPYRYVNKDAVWVEIVTPTSASIKSDKQLSPLFSEILPLGMEGMQWLENSPLFKELIVAENGECAFMTTINPLEFSVHKLWLGKQEFRDYSKHLRDQEQSGLVLQLISDYFVDIDIDKGLKEMKHFKKEVVDDYKKYFSELLTHR